MEGPSRALVKGAKRAKVVAAATAPLLDLGTLVPATVVERPSASIKSPYVADVRLEAGTVALAHAPGLELGGHCVPGASVMLSTGKEGNKTAFAIQLVRAGDSGAWIGAHPMLGNKLVAAALQQGLLASALGAFSACQAEVKHGDSRVDFVLTHADGSKTLVEVKSVVCADHAADAIVPPPASKTGTKPTFSVHGGAAYSRSALFPIGRKGQKLPDGTVVVSARAIKHVRELAGAVTPDGRVKAAIVFVVNRHDCHNLSLRRGACPVLPLELEVAARAGVRLHAMRVSWADGRATWSGLVPCDIPNAPR